jgi:hypothetical protein
VAAELVAFLSPSDLRAESSLGYEPGMSSVKPAGAKVYGVTLQKDTSGNKGAASYTGTFVIPGSLTMATGLTFAVALSDDGSSAADLGKNVRIGVTTKVLAANATLDMDAGGGVETKATITLSSTSLGVALGTIAIATANLGTAAVVGALLAVRVRRIGDDALDTCAGRVMLTGLSVANT